MPRSNRIDLPGLPQHIVVRGNNRNRIFFADADRALFLKLLGDGARETSCDIHAFVFMPNHVHLLATFHARGDMSRLVQDIGRVYVKYVNATYKRTGGLYEGRFFSSLVESSRYFITCMRYIELNPVRAGLVARPGDFDWSSFGQNVDGEPSGLITPHPEYLSLGRDREQRGGNYRRLFDRELDKADIDAIRRSVRTCRPLGSEMFARSVESTLNRTVTRAPQGRPRTRLKGSDPIDA